MNTKTILAFIAIATSSIGNAQTNTFPTSGNVGIGTTSPSSNLEISGRLELNNTSFISSHASAGNRVTSLGSNAYWTGSNYATPQSGERGVSLELHQGSRAIQVYEIAPGGGSGASSLNASIGLGGRNSYFNTQGGNFGIGTNNPQYTLDISSSEYPLRLNRNNPSYGVGIVLQRQGSDQWIISGGANPGANNFGIKNAAGEYAFTISQGGKVGIGTTSPNHELSVSGTIQAKEVIVETGWSDSVFDKSYRLRSLDEVESHIEEHGHLPDVPAASVVETEGLSVGEAQKIMMQKIEELTLYMIEQDKKNQSQQREIEELRKKLSQQNARYNSE